MKQALECASLPAARRMPSGRLARFFARLTAHQGDGLIRPDALSPHTLRDIGLAEDVRADHLLGNEWLRR